MRVLRTVIGVAWIAFWIYWIVSAYGVKQGRGAARRIPLGGVTALAVILVIRVFRGGSLAVHSTILGVIGVVVFAAGLGLAIWARLYLGRNWGMPMTVKDEPELVTSGPYRFVRHPIYTGLLLGLIGTALANSLIGLAVAVLVGGYFYYAARVEEKNLLAAFPTAYPAYRESTKLIIPFIL